VKPNICPLQKLWVRNGHNINALVWVSQGFCAFDGCPWVLQIAL
jgi:hypothetical protein